MLIAIGLAALTPPVAGAPIADAVAQASGKSGGKAAPRIGGKLGPGAGGAATGAAKGDTGPSGGAHSAEERRILDGMYLGSRILRALDTDDPGGDHEAAMLRIFNVVRNDGNSAGVDNLEEIAGFITGVVLSGSENAEYVLRGTDERVVAYYRVQVEVQRALTEAGPTVCFDALFDPGNVASVDVLLNVGDDIDRTFSQLVLSALGRDPVTDVRLEIKNRAEDIATDILTRSNIDPAVIAEVLLAGPDRSGFTIAERGAFCRFALLVAEALVKEPPSIAADLIRWTLLQTDFLSLFTVVPQTKPAAAAGSVPSDREVLAGMYAGSRILRALAANDPTRRPAMEEEMIAFFWGVRSGPLPDDRQIGDAELSVVTGLFYGAGEAELWEAEYILRGPDAEIVAYQRVKHEELKALFAEDPERCYQRLTRGGDDLRVDFGPVIPDLDRTFGALVEASEGEARITSFPDVDGRFAEVVIFTRFVSEETVRILLFDHLRNDRPLPASLRREVCVVAINLGRLLFEEGAMGEALVARVIRWTYFNDLPFGLAVAHFEPIPDSQTPGAVPPATQVPTAPSGGPSTYDSAGRPIDDF